MVREVCVIKIASSRGCYLALDSALLMRPMVALWKKILAYSRSQRVPGTLQITHPYHHKEYQMSCRVAAVKHTDELAEGK